MIMMNVLAEFIFCVFCLTYVRELNLRKVLSICQEIVGKYSLVEIAPGMLFIIRILIVAYRKLLAANSGPL